MLPKSGFALPGTNSGKWNVVLFGCVGRSSVRIQSCEEELEDGGGGMGSRGEE